MNDNALIPILNSNGNTRNGFIKAIIVGDYDIRNGDNIIYYKISDKKTSYKSIDSRDISSILFNYPENDLYLLITDIINNTKIEKKALLNRFYKISKKEFIVKRYWFSSIKKNNKMINKKNIEYIKMIVTYINVSESLINYLINIGRFKEASNIKVFFSNNVTADLDFNIYLNNKVKELLSINLEKFPDYINYKYENKVKI